MKLNLQMSSHLCLNQRDVQMNMVCEYETYCKMSVVYTYVDVRVRLMLFLKSQKCLLTKELLA